MEKPRIYVFSTAYYPFIGGAEIAIEEVSRRLKDRFDFYIVTSRMRRSLPKREVRPEGTIIRVGFGTRFDKWLLPLFVLWRLKIENWKFENSILWGMDISQGTCAAAILKFLYPRIPFVFTLQYGYGDERLRKGRGGMIGKSLSFFLSRADHVTAISLYLLSAGERYGYRGAKILIPNGVDAGEFRRPAGLPATREKIVVTTSRLVPKNGIDILIRAIAEVKKTVPDVQCHIIGDGPELNKLKILSEKLKVAECVKFFGSIPYEEIPRYLWQASVFARPSRSEGMGNSFVEALAAGLPVVGTPVGGITDIIEDGKTGLFSKPEDPYDLAVKIALLLRNPRLRDSIAKEGQKMVENRFGWERISSLYAGIFSSLLETLPLSVLVATPFLPPRLGGPAIYADALSQEFRRLGHRVEVVSFEPYLRFPSGIRHCMYMCSLARKSFRKDILFSLDYTSVGFPALIISKLFRIPLVVRVEGDFLWEHYVERTRRDVTLQGFYRAPPVLSFAEKLIFNASRAVFRGASVLACSSEWRKSIVIQGMGAPPHKVEIIQNVFAASENGGVFHGDKKKVILWAGRILYLKNLRRLLHACAALGESEWELHIVGDGPYRGDMEKYAEALSFPQIRMYGGMSRPELLKKMQEAAFFVLPSLSDVGPNVIMEALSVGTPAIMSRESGYAKLLRDAVLLVNPLDEQDIKRGIETYMRGKALRNSHLKAGRSIIASRGWPRAASEWISLFERVRERAQGMRDS